MHASRRSDKIALVRLALIGPAGGDRATFARMADVVLNVAKASRAIYLGEDDALNDAVASWAEALVGPDASDDGIWERALSVLGQGEDGMPPASPGRGRNLAADIDAFVHREKARLRLKSLEGFPPGDQRVVEIIGDRLALLVHDRASLDEDDVFSASLLVYGKSDAPLAKRIGSRWFLTPGPITETGEAGAVVLDDSAGDLQAIFYDLGGQPTRAEALSHPREGRVNVQE
jgi:hypothetical protein